ncbi:MAG TPA: efflux RND transporter periplasmic adaptor subunit [Pyrinomonadaceae bacterium]|nr:efflux RND transporter periplasmic adaptor subunit [Pyrinomonadaceae bacterium]
MSDKITQTDNGDASTHEEGSRARIEVETVQARRPSRRNVAIISAVALVALFSIVALAMWLRSGSAGTEVNVKNGAAAAKKDEGQTGNSEVKLSPEARAAAGIEIEGVTQRPAVAMLRVTGTVETNPQQTQLATTLVSGRVERVNVVLGDRVRAGSVLAVISSPEVAEMHGKLLEAETRLRLAERTLERVQRAENRVAVIQAKAKLDEAEATLRRTRRLIELGAGAGKDLIAAEAAQKTAKAEYDFQNNISLSREVQQAQAEAETARVDLRHIRQSLVTLGAHLTEGERENPRENISLVRVHSAVSGTITERQVNVGSGIQAGTPLFTVANISTVWVIANVPEAQLGNLRVGTPAEVRSTALGGRAVPGRVNYIDPRLNEETRTGRVRVELANPGERLKSGMFVEVGFQAGTGSASGEELVIPATAVQRIGDRSVVFIPKDGEEGTFIVRDVELGGEVDGYHRVLDGLKLGEKVVTKGSFILKTQLMKSELGEE